MRLQVLVSVFYAFFSLAYAQKYSDFELIYQWNKLEYDFPSLKERQQALSNGNFVPENGVPIDVAPFYGNNGRTRLFTTIPRFEGGIPYSLATVTDRMGKNGPYLQPYPDYSWHSSHGSNCDGITSAFRVAITECNQMWVIDSGIIGSTQHCQPQLLLFDLQSDQLVHRYRFNSSHYTPNASLLITPIVDVRDPPPHGRCANTMIYIADVSYHGLIIYDYKLNQAWRAENKFMYPDPDYGTHTIAGDSFTLMDGIFGVSTDKRDLYFHPLASAREYKVPLKVLDNPKNFEDFAEAQEHEFRLVGERTSETAADAIDSRGNMYFVTFNPIKLIRWNVNTPYRASNFIELSSSQQLLQFISGMKIVRNYMGREELWMISNRFQRIAAGVQNPNELNFRILKRSIDDMYGQNNIHGNFNHRQGGGGYGGNGAYGGLSGSTGSYSGSGLNKDLHNKLIFN